MTCVCDEEPALCAEPGSERGEWAGLAVNLARRTRSAATAGGRESRPPTTLQVLGENWAPSHLRAASAVNLRNVSQLRSCVPRATFTGTPPKARPSARGAHRLPHGEVECQPRLGDHVCREGQGRRQAISRGAVPRLASATRSCQVFSGRRHHPGSGMRPSWLGQRSAKVSSDVLSGFSLSLGAVGPAGRPSRLPIPGPQRAARRPLSELLPVTQARRPRAHWGVALDVPPWTGWRAQAGHVFWKQTIHEPASQHRRPPAAGPPAAARLPAPRNN